MKNASPPPVLTLEKEEIIILIVDFVMLKQISQYFVFLPFLFIVTRRVAKMQILTFVHVLELLPSSTVLKSSVIYRIKVYHAKCSVLGHFVLKHKQMPKTKYLVKYLQELYISIAGELTQNSVEELFYRHCFIAVLELGIVMNCAAEGGYLRLVHLLLVTLYSVQFLLIISYFLLFFSRN